MPLARCSLEQDSLALHFAKDLNVNSERSFTRFSVPSDEQVLLFPGGSRAPSSKSEALELPGKKESSTEGVNPRERTMSFPSPGRK